MQKKTAFEDTPYNMVDVNGRGSRRREVFVLAVLHAVGATPIP